VGGLKPTVDLCERTIETPNGTMDVLAEIVIPAPM
jgi:hypothetical protein